jgi:hypothetical protein
MGVLIALIVVSGLFIYSADSCIDGVSIWDRKRRDTPKQLPPRQSSPRPAFRWIWNVESQLRAIHAVQNDLVWPMLTEETIKYADSSTKLCRRLNEVLARLPAGSVDIGIVRRQERIAHTETEAMRNVVEVVSDVSCLSVATVRDNRRTNLVQILSGPGGRYMFLPFGIAIANPICSEFLSFSNFSFDIGSEMVYRTEARPQQHVLSSGWEHPKLDGTPDYRFKYNQLIHSVKHTVITLRSDESTIRLETDAVADDLVALFHTISKSRFPEIQYSGLPSAGAISEAPPAMRSEPSHPEVPNQNGIKQEPSAWTPSKSCFMALGLVTLLWLFVGEQPVDSDGFAVLLLCWTPIYWIDILWRGSSRS